jgi:hypothetical protein
MGFSAPRDSGAYTLTLKSPWWFPWVTFGSPTDRLARSNGEPVDPAAQSDDCEKIGDDIPPMMFETTNIKYRTIAQQEHDLAYVVKYPRLNC